MHEHFMSKSLDMMEWHVMTSTADGETKLLVSVCKREAVGNSKEQCPLGSRGYRKPWKTKSITDENFLNNGLKL